MSVTVCVPDVPNRFVVGVFSVNRKMVYPGWYWVNTDSVLAVSGVLSMVKVLTVPVAAVPARTTE